MLDANALAAYIQQHGIAADIIRLPVHTATVAAAADALGVAPDQIAKTLVFLVDGQPTLVIACGLAPVEAKRIAAHFGIGKKRVKLAPPDMVERETGYPVGTMPPFGQQTPLPTLLDPRVLQQSVIYAGGGDIDCMLRIAPAEMARVTQAQVVDVSRAQPDGPEDET